MAALRLRQHLQMQTTCMILLAAVALGTALFWLRPVLIPFVLALFLVYCITPVIDLLIHRLRVPWVVALVITFLLSLVALALVGAMVSSAVQQIAANQDLYKEQLITLWGKIPQYLPLERLGIDKAALSDLKLDFAQGDIARAVNGFVGAALNILSNGTLVVIFVFFLLLGKAAHGRREGSMLGEVEDSIKRYIVLKVVISIFTGGAQGLVLWFFGVKFAFLFAFLAFLLNFIPNIGPIIATLVPIPALPISPEVTLVSGTIAIALCGAVQIVSGSVVEPRIMGRSLDLHPVVVLLSLIFFGMIWGIVGMFLSTPIAAAIKIILSANPATRSIGNALAGRLESEEAGPVQPADG